MASLLESLPPELFNRVLAFLLHHEYVDCTVTSEQTHGYAFKTAILRVNHTIHNLAQTFFNIENRWVKIRTNLPRLLVCPLKLGLPVFEVPASQIGPDFPEGAIQASILFPRPIRGTTDDEWLVDQEELCDQLGNATETVCTTYLVLPPDLQNFMKCLRLNDLAYCARVRDNEIVKKCEVDEECARDLGLTLRIRVNSTGPVASYQTLLYEFSILHGHFHRCLITKYSDVSQSRSIQRSITTSHDSLESLVVEGLKLTLWLQHFAEAHTTAGRHKFALNAYAYCERFIDCQAWRGFYDGMMVSGHVAAWLRNIFAANEIAAVANACLARTKGNLIDYDAFNLDRQQTYSFALQRLDHFVDKYGSPITQNDPIAALLRALIGCDQVLRQASRMTIASRQNLHSLLRHTPDAAIESFVNAVYEFSRDLPDAFTMYTMVNTLESERALEGIKEAVKDVKPWRWAIHEDDVLIEEFKEGLQLGEGEEEDRYHLFETPWGRRGRPGYRYLL